MRRTFITMTLMLGTVACGAKGDDDSKSERDVDKEPTAESVSWESGAITPPMLALGDSLFHGLIGATSCQACQIRESEQTDRPSARWLVPPGTDLSV